MPSSFEINGPWLIDGLKLEELGKIIENIDKIFILALKDTDHNKTIGPKNVIMSFENDVRMQSNSLLEILKDQKTNNMKPIELEIEIGSRYLDLYFEFRIYKDIIKYNLKCNNEDMKNDITYEIHKWLEDISPSIITKYWYNPLFGSILIGVWIVAIIVLIFLVFFPSAFEAKRIAIHQAKELLDNGIDNQNQIKAIETLLEINSEYYPEKDLKTRRHEISYVLLHNITFIFICLIILSIIPKPTIGVGKLKKRVKFYKLWVKFVTISIPLSIFIGFISNFIIG
jgi:hypothetical protein